jgi:peptide/nickel transport system substrate-binding protein
MKRRRFLGTVGLGATAAAIAAACGSSEKKEETKATTGPAGGSPAAGQQATAAPSGQKAVRGGTLNVTLERDPTTFDPNRNQDVYGSAVLSMTVESLYDIDKDGNPAGRVIEKIENPQANIYVWSLRKGIKFQDGTDLNAEAVKFSLERQINDEKSVRRQDVKDITSIETPDPYTVKVTLKAPFVPFANKLSGVGAGAVLPPATVQKLGDNLQRDLTGVGGAAFKFVEWKRDTSVTVERSDTFWRKDADGAQLPYLDKIVFKIFPDENVRLTNIKTGEADIMNGRPPRKDVADLKKDSTLTVVETPDVGWQFVTLNTEKEPFNNPAVRRALSYAIDREQIVKTVLFDVGKVQDTPVPDSVPWAYDKGTHPYFKRDVAKAKQELAAAGKSGGVKFTWQVSNASPELQQVSELVKDQIKEAGLDMEIQLIEFGTLVQNANKGDYQSSCIGWSGGTDPDDHLYSLFYTKAGFNLSKYTNPAFDKLLDDGRTTLEQAKRADIYKQAQKVLFDDQPFIILYQNIRVFVARKSVQNIPTTFNGFYAVRDYDRIWKSK